jgi:hypothetical protein
MADLTDVSINLASRAIGDLNGVLMFHRLLFRREDLVIDGKRAFKSEFYLHPTLQLMFQESWMDVHNHSKAKFAELWDEAQASAYRCL